MNSKFQISKESVVIARSVEVGESDVAISENVSTAEPFAVKVSLTQFSQNQGLLVFAPNVSFQFVIHYSQCYAGIVRTQILPAVSLGLSYTLIVQCVTDTLSIIAEVLDMVINSNRG